MRSLILFDLHYQDNNPLSRRQLDRIVETEGDFDSVILGGDNAELSSGLQNHKVLFERLKTRFDCPAGFITGNHELWGKLANLSSWRLINEIFPDLGKEYGFVHLEQRNLNVGDVSFVGTYGHFDYSFLRQNKGVSMDELLKGIFVTEGKEITWKDRLNMDWEGKRDEEVCAKLIKAFDERIKTSTGKSISISHTIPRLSLNGWTDSPAQYFMEVYSGSNLIGDVLEAHGGEYHFCGHTHAKARDKIGRTRVINLGSDYNILRYAIFQKNDRKCSVEESEVVIS